MKLNKKIIGLGLVAVAALGLAACARGGRGGSSADSKVKAAIVTDTGGVDDKSFNQSAWEGLQEWGKANKLKKILALLTSNQTQSLTLQTICQLLKAKVTTSSLVLVLPFMMLFQMLLRNMKMLTT